MTQPRAPKQGKPDRKKAEADGAPALAERRNRIQPLAAAASPAAMSALARAGFRDATLVMRWDAIVGPEVARMARPVKLSDASSSSGATLTLKAEPGAAVFLAHETNKLCARINAALGPGTVARIRFVQGPLSPPLPALPRLPRRASAPPGDPAGTFAGPEGLRAALLALSRWRQTPRGQ